MPETQGSVGPKIPDGRLGHTAHLTKGRRGPGSAEYEFDVVHSLEYDTVFMDFRETTMPVDQIGAGGVFQIEELVGATSYTKLAPTALRPSHLIADMTGTDSTESLVAAPQYLPEQNCFIEVAFDLEAITNLGLFIGFVDAVPGSAALVLLDIDTPTLHADIGEAAGIGIDTAQTLTTAALVTELGGSVTKVDVAPTDAPFGIPTAIVQVIYRVELRDQNAYAFINGALVAQSGLDLSAATGTLLAPIIQFNAKGATDKECHLDYIYMGQERHTLLV